MNQKSDRSRRRFLLESILALGSIALGSTLSGCGNQAPVVQASPPKSIREISQEESRFNDYIKKIEAAGYRIDKNLTNFVKGSDKITVVLPTDHYYSFEDQERKTVLDLDRILELNVIGMEGIPKDIDKDATKKLITETTRYIQTSEFIAGEANEYTGFRDTYNRLLESATNTAELFKDDSDFRGWLAEINLEWTQTGEYLLDVAKDLPLFKRYFGSVPRADAPGLRIFNLETRTDKIGMEDQKLDSDTWAYFVGIVKNEREIKSIITYGDALRIHKENLKTRNRPEFDNLNQRLDEYLGALRTLVYQKIDFRDRVIRSTPNYKEYVKKTNAEIERRVKNGESLNDAVGSAIMSGYADDRSDSWVRNLAEYRTKLIVGGRDHRQRVYERAIAQGESVITLEKIGD